MSTVEQKCKNLLLQEGIDINSSIEFIVNGEMRTLSFGYIVETFMMASDESQIVFLTALETSLYAKGMGVDKFFEGMGKLLLMTHLSEKIKV